MTFSLDHLPQGRLLAELSTWSADLGRLTEDLGRAAPFADLWHVDVSDGHFAPAMLFFPDLVSVISRVSDVPVHVHLMATDDILVEQVRQFAEAGAHIISIHIENGHQAQVAAFAEMRARGVVPGVVLQLQTPVEAIADLPEDVRFITLLGTAIGVKGQGLDARATGRLAAARQIIAGRSGRHILAADGAIRETTVPELRAAGADTVVLGSLAFGATDFPARMAWIQGM